MTDEYLIDVIFQDKSLNYIKRVNMVAVPSENELINLSDIPFKVIGRTWSIGSFDVTKVHIYLEKLEKG